MADVTMTLGGVTLDPDLDWPERRQAQRVAQSVQPTIGGGLAILATELQAGIPITLASGEDFGWMKTPAVGALRSMADQPGATFTLSVDDGDTVEDYTVEFRHDERPAFDARPLIPRIVPEVDDDYRVTIKLRTL